MPKLNLFCDILCITEDTWKQSYTLSSGCGISQLGVALLMLSLKIDGLVFGTRQDVGKKIELC